MDTYRRAMLLQVRAQDGDSAGCIELAEWLADRLDAPGFVDPDLARPLSRAADALAHRDATVAARIASLAVPIWRSLGDEAEVTRLERLT